MKFATVLFALASALAVSAQTNTTATTDYIYLTAPIATSIFTAGKTNKITWKFTSGAGAPQTVSIDLLLNLALVVNIVPSVAAADGTYSWATPATLNSSLAYSVRLTDTNTAATPVYASYSHSFEIDGVGGKPTDTPGLSSSVLPSSAVANATSIPAASSNATSAASAPSNSTSPTSSSNSTTTTKASGAATKSGGNCLVALGVFAAALAML